MRNILVFVSCVAVVVAVGCEESKPRRGTPGTAGTSVTTGAAGTMAAAAGTTGAAGTDATGAAGTMAAAGTTGAAGTDATGAAGTAAAGTTGAAGTGAAGTAAAGTTGAAGDGAAGTMAAPVACANMAVKSPGGSEATCGAKTAWVATAMPTPAKGLFGIADNQLLPPYAIDGMTTTRYSSGATFKDGDYFQVDLGAAKMISGIVVTTTTNPTGTYDVANGYEVGVSTDGIAFTKVAMCAASAAPIETINFTATMGRYVRYTNKGAPLPPTNSATSWLSIHEFNVTCN